MGPEAACLYEHHDAETAAEINEGANCCCDPDEEPEEAAPDDEEPEESDPDEEPEDRELEERPMCRNCASEPSRKSALF